MKAETRKLAMADAKAEAEQKLAQQPIDEQAKLLAELTQAQADGDWKLLATKAKALADYQAKLEALELDAKQSKLVAIAQQISLDVQKLVEQYALDGKLDQAECICFDWDVASPTSELNVSLLRHKASTRKASTTGYGKQFAETTLSLLEVHGTEAYNDKLTYQQKWDSSTDKNSRYAVRKKLTEKYGTPTS